MTISTDEKYLLNNKMGSIARKVQLGTLIENAESVTAGEIAVAENKILIGSASGVGAAQSVSGDATLVASGALTIANLAVSTAKLAADAVDGTKIADDAVSAEHLDDGILPSHVAKYAGTFTTVGGDAAEAITVTGAAATDIVVVTVKTAGVSPASVVAAAAATNAINVTMSADPSSDHVLQYVVFRAVA